LQYDIEHLNADCTCVTLDRDALCKALEHVVEDPGFCRGLAATHPQLMSAQPLFLSAANANRMKAIIQAVEAVAALPAYQEVVLGYAPEIARYRRGPVGVFMGYDFHLGLDGPKLIEINTNAGGALINAYLLQAQRACCTEMALSGMSGDLNALCTAFVSNFKREWDLQGRTTRLQSIAIVDRSPREQYLYPEFVLFRRLFETHGMAAVIASPEELSHRNGALWHGDRRIDLVYNRLTDFGLAEPESQILRDAYLTGNVVLTPHPRVHALLANKKNLAILSDELRLRNWGVHGEHVFTLINGIPRTVVVTRTASDDLWARRSKLFFKPGTGFGSKAAYRGDKITRRVWADILDADYVAQDMVPPSTRTVSINGEIYSLKADLRNYTYDGKVQLVAARIYQGQTTNFRTPGGGFAPVFVGQPTSLQILTSSQS
jgi:hypothetical protein